MSRNSLLVPTPGTVTPGQSGDDSNTPKTTVDQFGRVTAISTIGTSGAGGAGTTSGVYSGRAAAGSAGALFFPTDGYTVQRDTGAAWVHFGPLYYLNQTKVVSDFAWINQGGATATNSKGSIIMNVAGSVGSSIRLLKRTAPATPWTLTVAGILTGIGDNSIRMGVCYRQSSDGKLVYVAAGYAASAFKMESYKFTNPTTYAGATYFSYNYLPFGGLIWLRIEDNGTNRITSTSADGQNWLALHTVGRTDFLTADEFGIAIDCNNAGLGTTGNFMHYVEA